jgi:hypothetical protein
LRAAVGDHDPTRVRLTGFHAHGMYGDRQSPAAVSCFEPVVIRIYAEDQELRPLV